MIISELKPLPEILGYLDKDKKLFLVGCKGCAEVCHTGDEPQVLEMKQKLEKEGKKVTGHCVVDFLCDKALVKTRLLPHEDEIDAADSLLVMTCGIGVQATAAVVNKLVHPAANTINVGGVGGTWRGSERCRECGDCVLDLTGGICPLTACTKSLVSGACGGASHGMCEISKDRPCGWEQIYDRLKERGLLNRLDDLMKPLDHNKLMPRPEMMATPRYGLENPPAVPKPAEEVKVK